MLMGNYELLMVTSINKLFDFLKEISIGNWDILSTNTDIGKHLIYFIIFLLGSVIGIIAFSHFISWIFKRYHDTTLAILTGFVCGSLSIIWPWKNEIDSLDESYERYLPESLTSSEIWVITFILLGIVTIFLIEFLAKKSKV